MVRSFKHQGFKALVCNWFLGLAHSHTLPHPALAALANVFVGSWFGGLVVLCVVWVFIALVLEWLMLVVFLLCEVFLLCVSLRVVWCQNPVRL
jgi:hypothetical protein